MNHRTWEIPEADRRSPLQQFLAELRHSLLLFWHYIAALFVAPPAPLTEGVKPDVAPVVIVPGFICRPQIYVALQRAIHAAGFPCHILDMGFQLGSIDDKARQLSAYLTSIGAREARVIGHSMGGLIVARCLQQGESRIRAGWTLGAPLWGTTIIYGVYALALLTLVLHFEHGSRAWFLLIAVFLVPALQEMLPNSAFLQALTPAYPSMTALTSVFCSRDLIAFRNPLDEPGSASRFGRESDVLFPEDGHNNLAMGDNAIRALVAALT